MIYIFGKDSCPYTVAARDDHDRRGVAYEYLNVVKSPEAMARMLAHTHGQRRVPVIVDGDRVTVGFGGT